MDENITTTPDEQALSRAAAIYAKEKRLAANHACAITASVRTGMKNGFSFRLIGVKKIEGERFEMLPKKTLFGEKSKVIDSPDKWFRYSYNKLRLCNIKVVLPERTAENAEDIDSEGTALACLYEDGHASLFVPEWQYNAQTDKWSVVYREKPCADPSVAKARFSDNSGELAAALTAVIDLTESLGKQELSPYVNWFMCGLEELNGRNANWDFLNDINYIGLFGDEGSHLIPLIRYPKLSEKTVHIYNAAAKTPVFGGKCYRDIWRASTDRGVENEADRLFLELDRCQRNAMLYTVNES